MLTFCISRASLRALNSRQESSCRMSVQKHVSFCGSHAVASPGPCGSGLTQARDPRQVAVKPVGYTAYETYSSCTSPHKYGRHELPQRLGERGHDRHGAHLLNYTDNKPGLIYTHIKGRMCKQKSGIPDIGPTTQAQMAPLKNHTEAGLLQLQ